MRSCLKFFIVCTLLITCLTAFAAPLNKGSKKRVEQEIELVKNCISSGAYKNAALLCDHFIETLNVSKIEEYELLQLKAKAFLVSENMVRYIETCESAYRLMLRSGPAYKALFYAQKSSFYHYLMIGDSALFYANKAMSIKSRYPNIDQKVPTFLIDQAYAISFLYNVRERKYRKQFWPQFQAYFAPMAYFFDRAKKSAFADSRVLPFERAIVLRSLANRKFDYLGYVVRSTKEANKLPQHYHLLHEEILKLYNEALSQCSKGDYETRFSIMALMSLSNYVMGKHEEGLKIYSKVKAIITKRFKQTHSIPLSLSLNKLINYRFRIVNPSNPNLPSLTFEKKILTNWVAQWETFMAQQKHYPYDTYKSSPYYTLSLIRFFDYQRTKNYKALEDAATYSVIPLKVKFNYPSDSLQLGLHEWGNLDNNKLKQELKHQLYSHKYRYSICLNSIDKTPKEYLIELQNYLDVNEAFLLDDFIFGYLIPHRLLITRDTICLFPKVPVSGVNEAILNNLSFEEYKITSYKNYKIHFESIIRKFPKLKRIYLNKENGENYSSFISSLKGVNYDELDFLGKKIDFVRLYDPTAISYQKVNALLDVLQVYSPDMSEFPFNNLAFSAPLKGYTYHISANPLHSSLDKEGIIHYIGHGEFWTDLKTAYLSPALKNRESLLKQEDLTKVKVNRDLIVLSSCYAGANGIAAAQNRYFTFRLLFNGAGSVIASPYQVDDESSSIIFRKFYTFFSQGYTLEDALFEAKLAYLESQPGDRCHPLFWSGFQLTTRNIHMRLSHSAIELPNLLRWFILPFILIVTLTVKNLVQNRRIVI